MYITHTKGPAIYQQLVCAVTIAVPCTNDMEQPSGMLKTTAALMLIVAAIFTAARLILVPKHKKHHKA